MHQPYRSLSSLRGELFLVDEDVQLAKSVINDHYMTDLPLLIAPHTIALVAILLALVLRPTNSGSGGHGGSNSAAAGLAAAQSALSQAQARALGNVRGATGLEQLPPPPTPIEGGPNQTGASGAKEKQQEPRLGRVQHFAAWLAESNVDIPAMVDATQEIVSFYECWEQYNEKLTRDQINRFIKARQLDR